MQSNGIDRRGDIRLKTQLLVVGGGAAGVARQRWPPDGASRSR